MSGIILGVVLILTLCFVNLYAAPVVVGNFTVDYVIASDWGTGGTINVTLKNDGPAINGWTVGWTFPGNQTITNIWNASYTQTGASVLAKDAGFNASLPTGGSTSFGFNLNYSGTNAAPTSFTVNSSSTTTSTPTQQVTPTPTSIGVTPTPTQRNATPTPTLANTPTPTLANTPTPTRANTPTPTSPPPGGARQMENLDRGVVAVKVSNGVFVSWRVLGTENSSVSYNLYRGSTKVNSSPLTVSNYLDSAGTTSSTYTVRAVVNGSEQGASPSVSTWGSNYLSVPISPPSSIYSANDCSVGDLDGDHQYEIVLKWDPSDAK
ncbi:MAG TPA: cellulose binding domain-containing protein, partial [Bacillota bacterium]|nr:cellulose binding domain-containing protein [Bacillota bacterium]